MGGSPTACMASDTRWISSAGCSESAGGSSLCGLEPLGCCNPPLRWASAILAGSLLLRMAQPYHSSTQRVAETPFVPAQE